MHSCWNEHQRGEETKIPLGKESGFAEKGVGREQRAAQPDSGGAQWCGELGAYRWPDSKS